MDKYIYDESNGLWYELQGDYYIPCLILSEEETQPIGLWGQRHREHLKEHKHIVYATMLMEGKLNSYLVKIDRQAEEMYLRLIKEMAKRQGVTEQLKAEQPMEWVGKMEGFLYLKFRQYKKRRSSQILTAAPVLKNLIVFPKLVLKT